MGHPALAQQARQSRPGQQIVAVGEAGLRARGEGHGHFPDRGVEAGRCELQHPVSRVDFQRLALEAGQSCKPTVRHQDRLGGAGRARGIEGVGGLGGELWVVVRGGDGEGWLQADLPDRLGKGHKGLQGLQGRRDQKDGGGAVAEEEAQAFGGVGEIERQVGGSRFPDAQAGGDRVGGAVGGYGHDRLRAQVLEQGGYALGSAVKLGVGEALASPGKGHGFGSRGCLGFEEVVQGGLFGGGRVVPLVEGLVPLSCGEEGQVGEAALRRLGHAVEQALQVAEQAPGAQSGDPARIVDQVERQGVSRSRRQDQRVRRALAAAHLADLQAGHAQGNAVRRVALEGHQRLEQRLSARHLAPPLRVHQSRMRARLNLQQPALDLPEPFDQPFLTRNRQPRRQGVDEHPHHRFLERQVRRPPGHHRAEQHIRRPGVAGQQHRPGAMHHRARSQPVSPRHSQERPGHDRPEPKPHLPRHPCITPTLPRKRSNLPKSLQSLPPEIRVLAVLAVL